MNLNLLQEESQKRIFSSPLIQSLFSNQATRRQYIAYMIDVYHYACHSSQVISIAESRLAGSHPKMASYLFEHAREELGHERWAFSDLCELGMSDEEIHTSRPSDACQKMLGIEYLYAAHLNPLGLFGWMYSLESLGGKVGSEISKRIDTCLNLKGKAIYFLSGHGQADITHAEDLQCVITEGIRFPHDESTFVDMVRMSSSLYCEILNSAAEVEKRS